MAPAVREINTRLARWHRLVLLRVMQRATVEITLGVMVWAVMLQILERGGAPMLVRWPAVWWLVIVYWVLFCVWGGRRRWQRIPRSTGVLDRQLGLKSRLLAEEELASASEPPALYQVVADDVNRLLDAAPWHGALPPRTGESTRTLSWVAVVLVSVLIALMFWPMSSVDIPTDDQTAATAPSQEQPEPELSEDPSEQEGQAQDDTSGSGQSLAQETGDGAGKHPEQDRSGPAPQSDESQTADGGQPSEQTAADSAAGQPDTADSAGSSVSSSGSQDSSAQAPRTGQLEAQGASGDAAGAADPSQYSGQKAELAELLNQVAEQLEQLQKSQGNVGSTSQQSGDGELPSSRVEEPNADATAGGGSDDSVFGDADVLPETADGESFQLELESTAGGSSSRPTLGVGGDMVTGETVAAEAETALQNVVPIDQSPPAAELSDAHVPLEYREVAERYYRRGEE